MEEKISVFCDGGAIGNPGPAAAAFIVYESQKIIYQSARRIGNTTNNVAEYQAVIIALEWLKKEKNQGGIIVNFFIDSQLVVNQLNGLYRIKDAKLRVLIIKVKGLEQECQGKIFYHLIPREKNRLADSLVKKSLLQQR